MNTSLPDSVKVFVDEQVSPRGYGPSSEYVRQLIRKNQGRLQLLSSCWPVRFRHPPSWLMRPTSTVCASVCRERTRPPPTSQRHREA